MKSIVALLREEGVKVWSSKTPYVRERIIYDGMQRIISLTGNPDQGFILHLSRERDRVAIYTNPSNIETFELADPQCFKQIADYLRNQTLYDTI